MAEDSWHSGTAAHSFKDDLFEDHDVQEEFRDYVSNNLNQRECKRYVVDTPDPAKGDQCQCGRSKDWHINNLPSSALSDDGEKWSQEKDTKEVLADSYGTISFSGFGTNRIGATTKPYVRIDSNTKPETIWSLLIKHWKIPEPKLLISVTGGARGFNLKKRLKNIFKRCLIDAATSTDAWIISGGTSTGVMKIVGEAVNDYQLTSAPSGQKIVALGIATWGIINNKKALVNPDRRGCFPATYHSEDLTGPFPAIDNNHTHFLFVDDGTDRQCYKEIDFRASLEAYISQKTQSGDLKGMNVPVVLLVLEGGRKTLLTAATSLKKDMPVVVIQGSGRAADVIAHAVEITKHYRTEENEYPPNFDEKMKAQARKKFRLKNIEKLEKNLTECLKQLKDCLQHRRLMTVFSLKEASSRDINQAILHSILEAHTNPWAHIHLALAWNKCDVANRKIFIAENREKLQKRDLMPYMFKALVENKADFVRLFLDNGVDMQRFLTKQNLRDLYEKVLHNKFGGICGDTLKNLVLAKEQTMKAYCDLATTTDWEGNLPRLLYFVGKVIAYLLSDNSENIYGDDRYVVRDLPQEGAVSGSKTEDGSDKNVQFAKDEHQSGTHRTLQRTDTIEFDHPERELFIWAILLDRLDLAILFWKNAKDHIGLALTGSALLKALSNEADKTEEVEVAATLLKHAREFEELAIGVLNECYKRDNLMTHRLLVREIDSLGKNTLFDIADSAEQLDFMGNSACQTMLNKIWKGKMALDTSMWKILLALVFPFMLIWIRFRTKTYDTTREISLTNTVTVNSGHFNKANDIEMQTNEEMQRGEGRCQGTLTQKLSGEEKTATRRPYRVGLPDGDCTVGFIMALHFYYTAPVTKFCYHTASYLMFLAIYSFFVMTDLHPISVKSPSNWEYLTWAWAATQFVEEIRQVIAVHSSSLKHKVYGYFKSAWNQFDTLVYGLLAISIVMRYTTNAKDFMWTKMVYLATLALFCLRFMNIFFVARNIGPKVIMIGRMLTDLIFFLFIMLIFILSYGVASHALLYPNAPVSWKLLKEAVFLPYWQMYGELFLENLEGEVENCSSNQTIWENDPDVRRCPEKSDLDIVFFAIYMMLTNVLLLNLLIAMFSHTFQNVQENANKVWRFHRYHLIYEYFDRPTLAPPLIIINHLYRVLVYFVDKCRENKINNVFRQDYDKIESHEMTLFEKAAMEQYMVKREAKKATDTPAIPDSLEQVLEQLSEIKESLAGSGGPDTEAAHDPSPGEFTSQSHLSLLTLDSRITELSTQNTEVLEIVKTLAAGRTQQPQLHRQVEIHEHSSGAM